MAGGDDPPITDGSAAIVSARLSPRFCRTKLSATEPLAWNEVVKAFIEDYIRPYLPHGSNFLSLFIYASIVTALAVLVTLQLTRIEQTLQKNPDSTKSKKA